MTFAAAGWLWLLPAALLLAWLLSRFGRRSEAALGYSRTDDLRDLEPRGARVRRAAGVALRVGALVLLILALARPQQGLRSDERDVSAADILLCLDVSDSMRAQDFAPADERTRLALAKDAAAQFVRRRGHDRLGLVVFGRYAMTRCPLTVDRAAVEDLLASLEAGNVPGDRTAVGDGLAVATERLKDSPARSKVIILLTDGASNAGALDPLTAAAAAAAYGIRIYTVGAGSPSGGFLTVTDAFGTPRRVRIADSLDEETLEKIASRTNGRYFRASDPAGLKRIFAEIDRLERTEISVRTFTEYRDRFEWALLPGLALLVLEAAARALVRTVP